MPIPRRVHPALALALCFAALAVAACGGDDDDNPTAIDAAAADARPPDATVDRCATLCECATDFCADDMAACMTGCAALDDSVIECRIQHCTYAQTNPSLHCPHAMGDETSSGIPPECIQN